MKPARRHATDARVGRAPGAVRRVGPSPSRSRIAWLVAALLAAAVGCRRVPPGLVASGDGVTLDQRTGLEWTSRDHDQALDWDDADRHCRELTIGDRGAWRLPELAELEALYDARIDVPCGDRNCHLDPAIRLGGPYVWTATTRGAGARFYYDFGYGNAFSPGVTPALVRRTICVRAPR